MAGALVPINAFVKTMLDYRVEAMKAVSLKPETARTIAGNVGGAVFDSLAIPDLTAAVKDPDSRDSSRHGLGSGEARSRDGGRARQDRCRA